MQLPKRDRNGVSGTARGLVYGDGASHPAPEQKESSVPAERSGSRGQLGASFRKVTKVSSHQTSLRRGITPTRPD